MPVVPRKNKNKKTSFLFFRLFLFFQKINEKIKIQAFLFFGLVLFFQHAGVHLLHRALVIRSYHGESTASHPNCEVKHR